MKPFSGHPAWVQSSSPPGVRGGVVITLPCMLQVSNRLDIWYIYLTDIVEWDRAYPGSFCSIFDPACQGGQNCKTAIAPDRVARLLRPCGCTPWYMFVNELHLFHIAPFAPAVSTTVDTCLPHSRSYPWYVHSLDFIFCFHVL